MQKRDRNDALRNVVRRMAQPGATYRGNACFRPVPWAAPLDTRTEIDTLSTRAYGPVVSYLAERREEEKERRRLEIIEAAERIYAERGWDLLTMDQVAKVARLSRGLVYVYFRDKDDLMLAIAARGLEKLAARFRDAVADPRRGLDKLEGIGRAYIAFGTDFPHYFDAQTRFNAGHKLGEDRPCEDDCTRAIDKVHTVIIETLRLGIADGSIRPDAGDVEVLAAMMWAFSHGLVQIITAKAEDLAARGISAEQLRENSIRMIQYMLATPDGAAAPAPGPAAAPPTG